MVTGRAERGGGGVSGDGRDGEDGGARGRSTCDGGGEFFRVIPPSGAEIPEYRERPGLTEDFCVMEGRIHYQCPSNFSPVSDCDGSVTSEPDTEIWLIRAPPDFNPESLNSHRLPLPGYKMQKVKSGGMKRFCHVLSSPCNDAPFTPLLCHPDEGPGGRLVCVPSFKGTITVAEAHGDPSALHTVPDRPPLSIPPGLKQRFQPFGALPPKGGGAGDSLRGTKKKKKAKKRRREETGH